MFLRGIPFISGMLISIMIFFNTRLSNEVGSIFSVFVIHFLGFLTLFIISLIFKWKIKYSKDIPLLFYTGGILGVLIVYFNNITIEKNGLFLSLGLIIAGQILASIYFEHKGILSPQKIPFNISQLPGVIAILIGSLLIIY